ncbi:MAG: hypothetical protein EOO02_05285 [Chitinophagaceae bacterium]|nr:MAG: hypothetical protein EOO02_05285 [Chitinophagaceae bacterium]
MKPLEYVYFNIYNHCYQRDIRSGEYFARFQAMYLFSLSVAGWVLFMQAVYLRFIKHSWFASKPGAMIFATTIYLLTAFVFHRIFIVNQHDQRIYDKFYGSYDRNPNKKRDLLVSFFLISIPYILLLGMAIFFPKGQ